LIHLVAYALIVLAGYIAISSQEGRSDEEKDIDNNNDDDTPTKIQ
jgi:hypothetical protein